MSPTVGVLSEHDQERVHAILMGEKRIHRKSQPKDPVPVPLDSELAYLAGFFDGEGSISISRSGSQSSHRLHVAVGSTDEASAYWFKTTFGSGSIRHYPPHRGNRTFYQWMASGRKAGMILRILLPHLRLKQLRARIALNLYDGGPDRGPYRRPMSDSQVSAPEWDRRETLRNFLLGMNSKKGHGNLSPPRVQRVGIYSATRDTSTTTPGTP